MPEGIRVASEYDAAPRGCMPVHSVSPSAASHRASVFEGTVMSFVASLAPVARLKARTRVERKDT